MRIPELEEKRQDEGGEEEQQKKQKKTKEKTKLLRRLLRGEVVVENERWEEIENLALNVVQGGGRTRNKLERCQIWIDEVLEEEIRTKLTKNEELGKKVDEAMRIEKMMLGEVVTWWCLGVLEVKEDELEKETSSKKRRKDRYNRYNRKLRG